MIRRLFFDGLLDTGPVGNGLLVVRDGYVNFFVARAPGGLICFDAGWRPTAAARGFNALGLDPGDVAAVFLTHAHWDHVRCLGLFRRAGAFVGEEDAAGLLAKIGPPLKATRTVRDGQTLDVAGATVKVIGTPGHTPGSVSYLLEGRFLFTGDTLRLRRGEVLPFLPCFNSDQRALDRSIRRLARLDGTEWLMTAHSGATGNWDKAFRRWREASFGGSSPGGCPA